jgi:osmoprotectant transport system ATP-binding protein
MIRLDKVKKVYGDGTVAVEELSLDVAEGELAVLVGPSGCGKTTTMRMINRLVDPSSGRIYVAGEDVTEIDAVQLRRRIGYVIQAIGLFPHQSVADNIATVPKLEGWDRARIKARVGELMELVGLDAGQLGKRYPHELSGGQRQRVGVARALAADPPVLLMDEPFGAVDPVARERLHQQFLELQQQLRKTIVFVTHDIDEAIKLGDRIAVMREGGHLEQYADPATLLSEPRTEFVRDFVGADRTLRRLAVTRIGTENLERWPVVAPTDSLIDCAQAMDADKHSPWAVVAESDHQVVGWLARAASEGDGIASDHVVPATVIDAEESLESALAGILATDAPGAIVTVDGVLAGVLTATNVMRTAARRHVAPEAQPR